MGCEVMRSVAPSPEKYARLPPPPHPYLVFNLVPLVIFQYPYIPIYSTQFIMTQHLDLMSSALTV